MGNCHLSLRMVITIETAEPPGVAEPGGEPPPLAEVAGNDMFDRRSLRVKAPPDAVRLTPAAATGPPPKASAAAHW